MNGYREFYGIDSRILKFVDNMENELNDKFDYFSKIRQYNQLKVIKAFQDCNLSQIDFNSASGYGYGDRGRDKTEEIFTRLFKAEDSLVRTSISSGTHALSLTLFGLLQYGNRMLSITGHPYDTLQEVIGIKGEEKGSLIERGIIYDYIDLKDNLIDEEKLEDKLSKNKYRLILIQRSTGYTSRRALLIDEIKGAIEKIRKYDDKVIIMVDNCYGEFTDVKEPIEIGADVIVGSLIKNPGGGIALSGGYIAGKKDLIERIANNLYAPGLGKETGLSFGTTRSTLQGLYFGPHITVEAIKTALLFAKVYEKLGFEVIPTSKNQRSDIICAIKLGNPDYIIDFCKAVQEASSVDSFVSPEPWDMPGYTDKIIMATGGFVDGSSIEVSADGPLREPYIVYYQGAMTYEQGKLACLLTLKRLDERYKILEKILINK